MARKKIKGRIIRILDKRTVVINLGRDSGINTSSIFYILGEPESVIDPETKAVLGAVTVTKSRVKALQVFDKFTVAATSWVDRTVSFPDPSVALSSLFHEAPVDEGELNVQLTDIQPWKAKSKSPVKVGDEVEVTIEIPEPPKLPENQVAKESSDETA
ncbi:MAG: hypothetical protein QOE33_1982 [Acidobacteriota bacterium]|nr:hypothetical protein [Acidobacteriota bacterium]